MQAAIEQERAALKAQHEHQLDLLKAAYESDVKALTATIEQLQREVAVGPVSSEDQQRLKKENEELRQQLNEVSNQKNGADGGEL